MTSGKQEKQGSRRELTMRSASALRFSKGCSSLNLDRMMTMSNVRRWFMVVRWTRLWGCEDDCRLRLEVVVVMIKLEVPGGCEGVVS